jgi:hypothetical protein
MRSLLFALSLPLAASVINSTSVSTDCHWIGGFPFPNQVDIVLTGLNTTPTCPVNYQGGSGTASSTVNGADATAVAHIGGGYPGSATAQAQAGFEVNGVAVQDGLLPLHFMTVWNLLTDDSLATISVAFYFNGLQVGGFDERKTGAGEVWPPNVVSNFLEAVTSGEQYTFGAQATAQAQGVYDAWATVEVSDDAPVEIVGVPEPGTLLLMGIVLLVWIFGASFWSLWAWAVWKVWRRK